MTRLDAIASILLASLRRAPTDVLEDVDDAEERAPSPPRSGVLLVEDADTAEEKAI